MVVYIGSRSPLPLIPWRQDVPAFNISELTEHEVPARQHISLPHVRKAGSHTRCGCGFNEGREHPQVYDDVAAARADALHSSAELVRYIREHGVQQLYSCWSGDESEPRKFERRITPEALRAPEFFFRDRELLTLAVENA